MARLTLSEQIKALTEDNKLRFHLHHEQIMALRHDRDYLREELSNVSYCLAQQLTINDLHSERMDQQSRQIEALTQLAQQQAEVIAALTDKLAELAGDHNALCQAVENLSDEEALTHQWIDRQQQRIVAIENRELHGDNAVRLDIHGAWITELFNRLNDHVNDHVIEG